MSLQIKNGGQGQSDNRIGAATKRGKLGCNSDPLQRGCPLLASKETYDTDTKLGRTGV